MWSSKNGRLRVASIRASSDFPMPWFRVNLNGRNFLLDSAPQAQSFFVELSVEAPHRESAEAVVRVLLENHPGLVGRVVNPADDPPLLFIEARTQANDEQRAAVALPADLAFYAEPPHDIGSTFEDLFDN